LISRIFSFIQKLLSAFASSNRNVIVAAYYHYCKERTLVQKLERLVESGTYFLFGFWFFGQERDREFGDTHASTEKEGRKKKRKKEVHQNKKAQATFQLF
jgi:hypothetical protein